MKKNRTQQIINLLLLYLPLSSLLHIITVAKDRNKRNIIVEIKLLT